MKPKRKYARRPRARTAELVDRDGLSLREKAFATAYLSNGFNAKQAYRSVHAEATDSTCATEGFGYLNKPHVKAHISRCVTKVFEERAMSGAEALGRLAQDAKSDVRELFDERGQVLLPHQWPETIANSVERFELTKDGMRVTLVSKLQARRTILELTGKLKSPMAEELSVLARALRGDLGLPEPGGGS
jgi:phage terminase small subunit